MNINDYGIVPNCENLPGIPARITAQHKERYEIVCEHGITYARPKTNGTKALQNLPSSERRRSGNE